jgi:hypothetical protein
MIDFPILPNPPLITVAWNQLIEEDAKIRSAFSSNTLQQLFDNIYSLKNNIVVSDVDYCPQIQSLSTTVANIIFQLNTQNLIDIGMLQSVLDSSDGSLQTISNRLQQMQ